MRIEFFTDQSDLTAEELNVHIDGEYSDISQLDDNTIEIIYLSLLSDERATRILRDMRYYGITDQHLQIETFIRCNWGALDRIPDIDQDNCLRFEYVKCGFKSGGCPFNKELCIVKHSFQQEKLKF